MLDQYLKVPATLYLSLFVLTFSSAGQTQPSVDVLARVQAAHEAAIHSATETSTGFEARNPGQAWTLSFDRRGFLSTPDVGEWTWGLELAQYGFQESEIKVDGSASASVELGRVTYAWNDNLEEWYINDKRGLEHGFTILERPEGRSALAEPLTLTLQVRGELTPQVQADRRGIAFLDSRGNTAVTYSGLIVFDANGDEFEAKFELSSRDILLSIHEGDACYPLTIDPVAQEAYIKASNAGISDVFGEEVAISGTTIIVGARSENSDSINVNGSQNDDLIDSGAAYVFVQTGTTWTQQAFLKAPTQIGGHAFGRSVAIEGDVAVVGAPSNGAGRAYVFRRNGTVWSPEQTLSASNAEVGDFFGSKVSVSGDLAVVAAGGEDSNATGINGDQSDNSANLAGAVYTFARNGTTWTQEAYLKASNNETEDQFGVSISVSGNTLVVGSYREDSSALGVNGDDTDNSASNSGAAYVFVRTGTTWSQQAYLKASNANGGDGFGCSVALDGDTLAIGALTETSSATGVNGDQFDNSVACAGAAYVFTRTGSVWSQEAYIKAFNSTGFSEFGRSVSIDEQVLVVGAPRESNLANGANGNPNAGYLPESGAVFVYRRTGTNWEESDYLKAAAPKSFNLYGVTVGVSGELVVVGNPDEAASGSGINDDPTIPGGFKSGAAYAYNLNAVLPTNTPGVDACSGDGGNQLGCVNCPCMNNAAPGTVGGCLNSVATSARLLATGDTSVSLPHGGSSDLRFALSGSPPNTFTVLNSGDALSPTNAANPCFGVSNGVPSIVFDGLRCAVMNTRRHGGRSADSIGEVGLSNLPWGGEASPQFGIALAGGGFVAGQTRYFQTLYRDDNTLSCMRGLNTSQAVEITFTP